MPMKTIKAKKSFIFDNKMRQTGDVFDASDTDANTLTTIGHADFVQRAQNYPTKVVEAEREKPQPDTSRNRYKGRRDLRAQE